MSTGGENITDIKLPLYVSSFLGRQVTLEIDRPLGSRHPKYNFIYPINYGFIPGSLAPDGEAVDVYLLDVNRPVKKARGICVAVIHRLNDNDDKLVVLPNQRDISEAEIRARTNFQEKYFKSEVIAG